jgi:hypothetical protein
MMQNVPFLHRANDRVAVKLDVNAPCQSQGSAAREGARIKDAAEVLRGERRQHVRGGTFGSFFRTTASRLGRGRAERSPKRLILPPGASQEFGGCGSGGNRRLRRHPAAVLPQHAIAGFAAEGTATLSLQCATGLILRMFADVVVIG